MDEKRRGEIAYTFLKNTLQQEKLSLMPNDFKRNLGNIANQTGISMNELREFTDIIYTDLIHTAIDAAAK